MGRRIGKGTVLYFGVGAIIVGAGAGAAVAFLNAKSESDVNVNKPSEMMYFKFNDITSSTSTGFHVDNVTESVHNGLIQENEPRMIKIGLYNHGSMGSYLMNHGANVALKMIKKFLERGTYGPELEMIPRIDINNPDLTSSSENGVYIPNTYQIGLNADGYKSGLDYYIQHLIRNGESKIYQKADDILSEQLFEILQHEFGHHISNVYVSSPASTDDTANIYEDNYESTSGIERIENRVSKKYADEFKKILGYDQTTKPINEGQPPEEEHRKHGSGELINPSTAKRYSLGTAYSADSVFKMANAQHPKSVMTDFAKYYGNTATSTGEKALEGWITGPAWTSSNPVNRYATLTITNEDLLYYYSFEELFTRKLELASTTIGSQSNWNSIIDTFFGGHNTGGFLPSIAMQQLKYENPKSPTSSFSPLKTATGGVGTNRYMSDYVFGVGDNSRAKSLVQSVEKAMGMNSVACANLSVIWNRNDFRITSGGGGISSSTAEGANWIKFGGFLPSKSELPQDSVRAYQRTNAIKYIMYYGDETNKKNPVFLPINVSNSNMTYKTNIFDAETSPDISRTRLSTYTLKDYVKASEIQGKKLYFVFEKTVVDGKDDLTSDPANIPIALETYRGKETKGISNSFVKVSSAYESLPLTYLGPNNSIYLGADYIDNGHVNGVSIEAIPASSAYVGVSRHTNSGRDIVIYE